MLATETALCRSHLVGARRSRGTELLGVRMGLTREPDELDETGARVGSSSVADA
jgi:hypothetical protein